jgi:ribosomal protein S18 acetylase RimI-like enzyme
MGVGMPGIDVRVAMTADIAAMIPVINAAFAVETFLEGTRTDENRMSEMMRKGQFLIAEDAFGRAVASVYWEIRGARAYFGMLAVDPACQGRGLGRTMMEAAEEQARNRGCLHADITVLSLRPELPPMYRKMGFVETGTEEFHPSQPLKNGVACHSIVMSKCLERE